MTVPMLPVILGWPSSRPQERAARTSPSIPANGRLERAFRRAVYSGRVRHASGLTPSWQVHAPLFRPVAAHDLLVVLAATVVVRHRSICASVWLVKEADITSPRSLGVTGLHQSWLCTVGKVIVDLRCWSISVAQMRDLEFTKLADVTQTMRGPSSRACSTMMMSVAVAVTRCRRAARSSMVRESL